MRTELKANEKLLLVIRHHWLRLVMPIAIWLVIFALAIWQFDAKVALLIILVTALYPLFEYSIWTHNIWAVTSIRVIDEGGFFTRHAKESPLEKINNIEYEQTFWGRIFGYGDVEIQTAAELGESTYHMIHHPRLLKDTITHAQEEYKSAQVNNQAQQLARAIAANQAVSQHAAPSQQMVADELHKLFELLQKGAITENEYASQKSKLLT